MALDLLGNDPEVPGAYVVKLLCWEAMICIDSQEEQGNAFHIEAATFEVGRGFLITDAQGRTFRLKIEAQEVSKEEAP